ncbi:hypothetical protein [Paraburkholderia sp. MM5477-R1]|uniref:hypothetical protein n=1 Tax=Paraburkholderia sp. MM5477-R1 TaxID=2991062 RepID=UPI003D23D0F0
MGQKFAALDAKTGIVVFYDSVVSPPPADVSAIEITDEQYQAASSTPGYTISSGALEAPTAAQLAAQQAAAAWSTYQAAAQAALDKSDLTIVRCTENAVTVPAAWATYRKALRAIVGAASGDPTQALPTKPAYPSGT